MKDDNLLGQEGDMESSRPEQVPWTLTVGSERHREASGPVVSFQLQEGSVERDRGTVSSAHLRGNSHIPCPLADQRCTVPFHLSSLGG